MVEPTGHDQNPYAPPSTVAGPVDPNDADNAPTAEAGFARSQPWEILYRALSLIDRITAVLLGLISVGSIITLLINPRGWISLGKVAFASFCVERYLVMPALAVLLMKIGRGLREFTDRARSAHIGFSASFLILYFAVKVFYAPWNTFRFDTVVMWLVAWFVWSLCGGAHIGSIYLLSTSGARTLTTGRCRGLTGRRPRLKRWLLFPLTLVWTLVAIGTIFGIWIICQDVEDVIDVS